MDVEEFELYNHVSGCLAVTKLSFQLILSADYAGLFLMILTKALPSFNLCGNFSGI